MKYVLVTATSKAAQMEVMSEDGTTFILQNYKNNYPENVYGLSGAVTDENTIVACGGKDGKFF